MNKAWNKYIEIIYLMTYIQYVNNNECTMILIVQYNNKNDSCNGYRDKLSCLKSTGVYIITT